MWIGSLALAPHWSSLALALGAGAILQVVVEVALYLVRPDRRDWSYLFSTPVLAGLAVGAGFMHGTAMLVKFGAHRQNNLRQSPSVEARGLFFVNH